jgi:hypothetical protein
MHIPHFGIIVIAILMLIIGVIDEREQRARLERIEQTVIGEYNMAKDD